MKALVEGDYYRVTQITRVTGFHPVSTEILPISKGLGIEERLPDGHYYVVAFVRPDKEGNPNFKSVGFRAVDTLDPKNIYKLNEWLNCVQFAKDVMNDIKQAKEEAEWISNLER